MEVASGQNQGQVCEFPFSIDGHEFYDCTYYKNADICKCFTNFQNSYWLEISILRFTIFQQQVMKLGVQLSPSQRV